MPHIATQLVADRSVACSINSKIVDVPDDHPAFHLDPEDTSGRKAAHTNVGAMWETVATNREKDAASTPAPQRGMSPIVRSKEPAEVAIDFWVGSAGLLEAHNIMSAKQHVALSKSLPRSTTALREQHPLMPRGDPQSPGCPPERARNTARPPRRLPSERPRRADSH